MKLIIGYGNTLRGDDGVGQHVAGEIEAQGWPGVQTIAITQLLPELAPQIAEAEAVFFVDADLSVLEVRSRALVPDPLLDSRAILAHHANPVGLLTLAQMLYGRCPPATLISVPANDMGLRDGLSETTQLAATIAVAAIAREINLER